MRKLLPLLLALGCTNHARLSVSGAIPGSTFSGITWGALTLDAGGIPCLALDGGAGTYVGDPVVMGAYLGQAESGSSFFCNVISDGGTANGSFTVNQSNDGALFAAAASPATALLDGGWADGGVPGWVILGTTAVPYADISITTTAAQPHSVVCCNVNTVTH